MPRSPGAPNAVPSPPRPRRAAPSSSRPGVTAQGPIPPAAAAPAAPQSPWSRCAWPPTEVPPRHPSPPPHRPAPRRHPPPHGGRLPARRRPLPPSSPPAQRPTCASAQRQRHHRRQQVPPLQPPLPRGSHLLPPQPPPLAFRAAVDPHRPPAPRSSPGLYRRGCGCGCGPGRGCSPWSTRRRDASGGQRRHQRWGLPERRCSHEPPPPNALLRLRLRWPPSAGTRGTAWGRHPWVVAGPPRTPRLGRRQRPDHLAQVVGCDYRMAVRAHRKPVTQFRGPKRRRPGRFLYCCPAGRARRLTTPPPTPQARVLEAPQAPRRAIGPLLHRTCRSQAAADAAPGLCCPPPAAPHAAAA